MHRETGRSQSDLTTLDTYLDNLTVHHAAVSVTPHGRISPRLTVDAPDPAAAVGFALEAESAAAEAAGVAGVVTAVTVADAATPDGEATWIRTPLLNLAAVGKLLGVSRQRAGQLANEHPSFPAAVAGPGSLFEQAAVEQFLDSWDRKGGRPAGRPAKV